MAFWLVATIACGVNLMIVAVAPWTGLSREFGGDPHDGYLELARSLLAGNGYVFEPGGPPVLHRPPLYPWFLLPVVALPESLQRPALIVLQSGLVGGMAAIAWSIGTWLFGQTSGRISVGVMLLDPWLLWSVKNPMSVMLQALLYTAFCELLLRRFAPGRSPTTVGGLSALLLGAIAGALALVHGTMVLTCGAVLVGVALWRLWHRDVRSAAGILVACALMLAIIAPWTARNWYVSGLFIPVVGNSGFSYFVGNAHWGIGAESIGKRERQWEAAFRHSGIDAPSADVVRFFGITDPALDRAFNRRMIEHVRSRPDEFLLKLPLNAVEYYFPVFHWLYSRSLLAQPSAWISAATARLRASAITLFHLVLWALALTGVARSMRGPERQAALGVLALVVVFPLAYLPFLVYVGHSHYVLPTIPLLSILAALGLGARNVSEAGHVMASVPVVR
jgi:4-amino-4-deoxy-L-arabinose transferase-like glycosyltransferase